MSAAPIMSPLGADQAPLHPVVERFLSDARAASTLKPIGARVILRLVRESDKTTSGLLYVPDTAKARSQRGVVVAVGPGREWPSGHVTPPPVKVGETVVFNRYAELPVWDDKASDHTLVAVSQEEILAVLEEG